MSSLRIPKMNRGDRPIPGPTPSRAAAAFRRASGAWQSVLGALFIALCPGAAPLCAADRAAIREVRLDPADPWPAQFELEVGETAALRSGAATTEVKLVAVRHRTEPDYWTRQNSTHAIFSAAEVAVEVDGRREELLCRPYEMPRTLGGVRLYVETTKEWATVPQLDPVEAVEKAVRFSAVAAGRPWGPEAFEFPIREYRWRSSTYENTWGSLVPFNVFYYHRGEDFGAIPDRLGLAAVLPGTIEGSPLPAGDGRSNGVIIDVGAGWSFRYGHMNLEHIERAMALGAKVAGGQPVGRTGSTWNGQRGQHSDPHVHLGLKRGETDVSLFPTLVEAYFRAYDDPLIAIAGGYGFVMKGGSYTLDGSRSLARPGRKIGSYRWRLHDGRELDGPRQTVTFDQMGFFAEELIVRADDGSEERDAIHVRVFNPEISRDITAGWLHYSPARAIRPGTSVTFWNRLGKIERPASIDFGDGSPPEPITDEVAHVYQHAGLYTVALSARGITGETALLKVRLRVEADGSGSKP